MTDIAPPPTLQQRLARLDSQIAASHAKATQEPEKRGTTAVADAVGSLIRQRVCLDCQGTFEGMLSLCPDCADARYELDQQKRRAAADKAKAAEWLAICPPLYRDTDWSRREIAPECVKLAGNWTPGSPVHSLALFGTTGKGKTRAAFSILSRHHARGWSVYAIHAGDAWDSPKRIQGLSSAARLQYSETEHIADSARHALNRARDCDLLLLDDVGKERAGKDGRLSEAVGESFFGLIEFRLSHLLPTIWTCNAQARDLMARFGPDRGAPLMRRLSEASETPTL